jgi:hypothetical protein
MLEIPVLPTMGPLAYLSSGSASEAVRLLGCPAAERDAEETNGER